MQWPEGFMWGTGASSTQCEGAAPASDWWDWERAGQRADLGRRQRLRDPLRRGLRAPRRARAHPPPPVDRVGAASSPSRACTTPPRSSTTATCCAPRATPASSRGCACTTSRCRAGSPTHGGVPRRGEPHRARGRRHVDFVAETFGDLVGGWKPVNETNYYALLALPRRRAGRRATTTATSAALVDEAIHLATAEAAVRLRQTGAPVASIFGLSRRRRRRTTTRHRARSSSASTRSYWAPGLGLFRDGVLRVPRPRPGRAARPRRRLRPDRLLVLRGDRRARRAGSRSTRRTRRVSPLGYGIWADGLGLVLDRLHARAAGHAAARRRVRHRHRRRRRSARAYLERGLEVAHDAIARGIDVRGFFHWTARRQLRVAARLRRRASASSTATATCARARACCSARHRARRLIPRRRAAILARVQVEVLTARDDLLIRRLVLLPGDAMPLAHRRVSAVLGRGPRGRPDDRIPRDRRARSGERPSGPRRLGRARRARPPGRQHRRHGVRGDRHVLPRPPGYRAAADMARIREIVIDAAAPRGARALLGGRARRLRVRAYDAAEIARLAAKGRTPETDPRSRSTGRGRRSSSRRRPSRSAAGTASTSTSSAGPRDAEVARLVALGASVRDEHATYSVLLDPEGNEFCVRDPDARDERAPGRPPRPRRCPPRQRPP